MRHALMHTFAAPTCKCAFSVFEAHVGMHNALMRTLTLPGSAYMSMCMVSATSDLKRAAECIQLDWKGG
jgi:hypothetical protein